MAAKLFQFPEKVIISWYLKKKLSLKQWKDIEFMISNLELYFVLYEKYICL